VTGPWGTWELEILDPRGAFLKGKEDGDQYGEPGLIDALLAKVGEINRWCFEVGAADGVWLSNTKRQRARGWSAVLIEADDEKFDKLADHGYAKVRCIRQKAEGDDLDRLLARCGAPVDLDFGVIDVDGQDWWLWKGMKRFYPRVLMVEYSGALSSPVPPEGAATKEQAGLAEIVALGQEKGYVALCRTNVNVLFARADVLDPAARSVPE
jgi:hypothetical protein